MTNITVNNLIVDRIIKQPSAGYYATWTTLPFSSSTVASSDINHNDTFIS